ncbi:MAG: Ribosomal RNA small subunit methyltransferase B [Thermoanaerobacterales bacterium 50_218]|nr:MAG: Ribosomal RNA small subunit methyltransferase B [Thermoanaerobacterales bacterium 50_218]HAA89271.1 16S rRNA (cytosine(967)-C(5))-methyltransferase RsmB [Peptococcaceae bacterium]
MKEKRSLRFSSAREGAVRVLLAVEQEGAFANLVLRKIALGNRLKKVDVNLLTELVYGTLRFQNALDWVIDQFSSVPVKKMHPVIRNIVRTGVYQLLYLDRIPASAACNEAVKLTKRWNLGGLAGFVNGLLRSIARNVGEISYPSLEDDPVLHISVKYSHPAWLVERWLSRFGREETINLCKANNQVPPLVLRCNTLKTSPEKLQELLEKEGIAAEPSPLLPEGLRTRNIPFLAELDAFQEGLFVAQDESSMLASHLLNPCPGSFVVDACSGPGGKTTHLAQLMKNQGKILALDIHEHRLKLVEEACFRLGISIVETRLLDARALPEELWEKADYLLVDVPCSGLGVIRRRPDLRWRVQESELEKYSQQQLEILSGASRCLKRGGILVYSTCSTEPEENLDVVSRFLAANPDFEVKDIRPRLPFSLDDHRDRETAAAGYLQLLPHRHHTDGFFLACLEKLR